MKKAQEMAQKLYEDLAKAQSPIVARARRKILKEAGLPAGERLKLKRLKIQKSELFAGDSNNFHEPLAKNEYQITAYDSGDIMMEFGPDVPEDFKRRAMEWAKRKGLKAKAHSMNKSSDAFNWTLFGAK